MSGLNLCNNYWTYGNNVICVGAQSSECYRWNGGILCRWACDAISVRYFICHFPNRRLLCVPWDLDLCRQNLILPNAHNRIRIWNISLGDCITINTKIEKDTNQLLSWEFVKNSPFLRQQNLLLAGWKHNLCTEVSHQVCRRMWIHQNSLDCSLQYKYIEQWWFHWKCKGVSIKVRFFTSTTTASASLTCSKRPF